MASLDVSLSSVSLDDDQQEQKRRQQTTLAYSGEHLQGRSQKKLMTEAICPWLSALPRY